MKKAKASKGPLTEIASHLKQKCFDMEELVADNIGLEQLDRNDLKQFPNLQFLYIPNNKLTILDNLENNFRLTFIDARNNQISDIDIPKQEYIRELYLSGNLLHDFDRILAKMTHMKDLETLDLRGNPLTLEKGYRQSVISQFQFLKTLDGIEVVRPEKKKIDNATRQAFLNSISRGQSPIQSKSLPPQNLCDTEKDKEIQPDGDSSENQESNSGNSKRSGETIQSKAGYQTLTNESKTIKPSIQSTESPNNTMKRTRPRTVLQCLLTRPLSSADSIVKKKSDHIRYKRMQRQKRIEEEQTAVARKRKEEFEKAANLPPPLPDALLELEMKNRPQNTVQQPPPKRSSTRMFIKQPVIQDLEQIPDELEIAAKLNPELPNVFKTRVTYKTLYPL